MPSDRSDRVLRGSSAAVFATFVALLSHVAGGGQVPGALGVVAPLVLSTAACVLLAGRRLTLLRTTLSVVVSQVLFHTLFVLGTAPRTAQHPGAMAHGTHGSAATVDLVTGATASHHTDVGMWSAHLAAGLVTIAAFQRAGSLLAALAGVREFVFVRLIRRALTDAPPTRPTRVETAIEPRLAHPLGFHPETTALRGPPLATIR